MFETYNMKAHINQFLFTQIETRKFDLAKLLTVDLVEAVIGQL